MTVTEGPRTIIDADTYTVSRTILVSAPVDKVWAAVTEPEHMSTWFAPTTTLDGRAVGATGVFTFDANDSIPVRIEEIDAPRMIAYRWSNDDAAAARDGGVHPATIDDEHSLLMRFTLEATAEGTLLTVVETGFETTLDPEFNMESHRLGWNGILDKLIANFA